MLKISIPGIKKTDLVYILIIVVIGFIARMAYLADYAHTEVFPILKGSDSYCYYIWGKDIASGDIWGKAAFLKWPLYAYFLGLWFKLLGESIVLIYVFQFLLGIANALLIYFIGRKIFSRSAGFIAGLLYVWYGLFVFFEGSLIYTPVSLFLNSLFLLYLFYLKNILKKINFFWAGLLLGIAIAAQANILIFGVLAAVCLLAQSRLGIKIASLNFMVFLSGLLIILGGMTLRNYLVEKDFVFISGNGGINFYLGNSAQANGGFSRGPFHPSQDEMFIESRAMAKAALGQEEIKTSAVSDYWYKKSCAFIKNNPRAYFRLLVRKFSLIFNPQEFVFETEYRHILDKIKIFKYMFSDLKLILPFACLGMILGLGIFRKTAWLYLAVISFAASMMLFFVASRYRIVILPFLFLFAGFAVFSFWEVIKSKKPLRLGIYLVLLAAFFIFFSRLSAPRKLSLQQAAEENFNDHFYKAMLYDSLGRYPQELAELEIADKIVPGNEKVALSYGLILARQGDLKSAEGYFKRAIEISPFYVDAYYNLGFVYNRQQQFSQAKQILEKAIFLNPDDLGSHFELGRAQKALGKTREAKKEFEFVLKTISRWRKDEIDVVGKELAGLD